MPASVSASQVRGLLTQTSYSWSVVPADLERGFVVVVALVIITTLIYFGVGTGGGQRTACGSLSPRN